MLPSISIVRYNEGSLRNYSLHCVNLVAGPLLVQAIKN